MGEIQLVDYARFITLVKQLNRFSDFETKYLKDLFLRGTYPEVYHCDVFRELAEELHMIPEGENIYDAYSDEIEEHFDIEGKNIVEVGGGMFFPLAKRLKLRQKSGTITVYDPQLVDPSKSDTRLILNKKEFTAKTTCPNTDLFVGLMPCKGAEALLDAAISRNVDFILWLCEGGPHGEYIDYYEDDDEWLDSTLSHAEYAVNSQGMGAFRKKYLPHYSNYPIIYNERKK